MQRNIDPDRQIIKPVPAHMVRCLITLTGSDADFGIMTWTTANATAVSPNTTKRTTSRQLLHSYSEPPNCKANTRQAIDGMKNNVPRGSRRIMCSLNDTSTFGFFSNFSRNRIAAKATPPTGRFIQKHHRQVAFSVKAPPIKGPTAEDTPKTRPNIAGLRLERNQKGPSPLTLEHGALV